MQLFWSRGAEYQAEGVSPVKFYQMTLKTQNQKSQSSISAMRQVIVSSTGGSQGTWPKKVFNTLTWCSERCGISAWHNVHWQYNEMHNPKKGMAHLSSSRSQYVAIAVIWFSTTHLRALAEGFGWVGTPETLRQFEGDLVEKLSAMGKEAKAPSEIDA